MKEEENNDEGTSSSHEQTVEGYDTVQPRSTGTPGFFSRVIESCSNRQFYGLPIVESLNKAFFYFIKISLLAGIISGLIFGATNWNVVERIADDLKKQMPTIHVKDGKFQVDRETPYRLTVLDRYDLIIDPKATLNRLELEEDVLMVLVNGALYVRNGTNSFEGWPLNNFSTNKDQSNVTLNAQTVTEWTSFFQWSVFVISVMVMIIGVIFQNTIACLLLSSIGILTSNPDESIFGWSTYLKISFYVLSPLLILDTLLFAVGISSVNLKILLLLGGSIYFYSIINHLENNLRLVSVELTDDQPTSDESHDT